MKNYSNPINTILILNIIRQYTLPTAADYYSLNNGLF